MSSVYYSSFQPDESLAGAKGSAAFPSSEDGLTVYLTVPASVVSTMSDGSGGDFSASGGFFIATKGGSEVAAAFSVAGRTPNTSWISINATTGQYTVTDPGTDSASAILRANIEGTNYDLTYSLAKSRRGISGLNAYLTNESTTIFTYANGIVVSYAPATGSFRILNGSIDISSSFSLSTQLNPQGLEISYSGQNYTVTGGLDASEDTAAITIRATGSGEWSGIFFDKVFSISKSKGGYEIVPSLPPVGDARRFEGSIVFLTTDDKLYRFDGTNWTTAVPAADISGQLIATQIANNSIGSAKIVDNSIITSKLADAAVELGKLAANSVDSSKILANAITADKIVANAITADKINANAITADKIAANAVTTSKIVAGAVTADTIAANAIVASKLAITNSDIFPDRGFRDLTWHNLNGLSNIFVDDASQPDQPLRILRFTPGAVDRFTSTVQADNGEVFSIRVRIFISGDAAGWWGSTIHFPGLGWVNPAPTSTRADVDSNGYPVIDMASTTIPKGVWNTYTVNQVFSNIVNQVKALNIRHRSGLTAGQVSMSWEVVRAASAELIVDGAITATKVAANAITADKIKAGAVTAAKIAVTELSSITANVGTLTAGVIRNTSDSYRIDVTNGRTIVQTGSFMKVSGAPFGSSNQFIEWYGPFSSNLSSCTEANATYYLKTNGSAYFGGTLSAGILRNAAQTTDLTTAANVIVGPFSTNGGTKTVTLSYEYERRFNCTQNTGSISGTTSISILLQKSTNGGASWTTITTLNASEEERLVDVDTEPGVQDFVRYRAVGSTTATDNTGAGTMMLRGILSTRTLPTITGAGITNSFTKQVIGVISIE